MLTHAFKPQKCLIFSLNKHEMAQKCKKHRLFKQKQAEKYPVVNLVHHLEGVDTGFCLVLGSMYNNLEKLAAKILTFVKNRGTFLAQS